MGYDPYLSITPAVINVLCLPAASIRAKTFEKYVTWLQSHARCVPCTTFKSTEVSTTLTQSTNLLFNYSTDNGPNVLRNSSFYEPNRQVQIALGLIDASILSEETDLLQLLRQAYADLQLFLRRNNYNTAVAHLLVITASAAMPDENFTYIQSTEDTIALSDLKVSLESVAASALSLASRHVEITDAELPTSIATLDRLGGVDARSETLTRPQAPSVSNGSLAISGQNNGSTKGEGNVDVSPGQLVALGILSIQQGDWLRALGHLVTAAKAARDVNDPAWHAKALEGLLTCMLLLAWAGTNFKIPQDCYPSGRAFPSGSIVHAIADANRAMSDRTLGGGASGLQGLNAMIPGLIATIMNLLEKASTSYEDGLPPLTVCEARIRLANLLVIVSRHGGSLSLATLNFIVDHQSPTTQTDTSKIASLQLTLRPSLLGGLLIESITEAQARLSVQSAMSVYLAVCNSLANLQLDRKLGFYLKEVLQKLPYTLVEARRVGAAETAIHPSSAGLTAVSSNVKEHEKISQGVRSLLEQVVRIYGLPEMDIDQGVPQLSMSARLNGWKAAIQSGDFSTRLEIIRLCIRVSDTLPDWLGSMYFMSLLLFVSRQSMTVSVSSFSQGLLIPTEEQTRLLHGIQHTSNAAQKQDLSGLASYWDDFLVRQIALHETPSAGKLMPHSSQDLSLATVSGTDKRDPFIYNPFSANSTTAGPLILVKGEPATFDVLLQNPLEVDVEVERISLTTQGCAFEAQSHNVILGPLCVQKFTMKGVAKEVGSLFVTGCNAKVKYCHARDFDIYTDQWRPLDVGRQKVKKPSSDQADTIELPTPSSLELRVIDPLPHISIHSTSLTQNSVMLLEGETCQFEVTLKNSSDIPADLVLFGYQDSVTQQLQEALSTKDLQPVDMFELQHQLTGKEAIQRISHKHSHKSPNPASSIEPQMTRTFGFEILGKAGLTAVTVIVDYAFLGKPRSEVEGTFYTRQLKFEVSVTVNASIDIPRCNILSLPANQQVALIQNGGEMKDDVILKNDHNEGQHPQFDHCLLQLDLRSIWPSPMSVKIESCSTYPNFQGESRWWTAAHQTLQPGVIERALILLPKIFVQEAFAPIPSLDTKRQFVVSASALSLEAEMATREAFWYRDRLCQGLRISWHEEHGRRSGVLDVRKGIRLSARMIDALKVEHVRISFEVLPVVDDGVAETSAGGTTVRQSSASEFILKRGEFARLIVRVQNLSAEDLKLLLRLQPSIYKQPHNIAMDLSKKFLWSGALQQVLRSTVGSRETVEAELGIVALVIGSYEINATVEEVRSRARRADLGLSSIAIANERRIWHARRPCLIHAVEGFTVM